MASYHLRAVWVLPALVAGAIVGAALVATAVNLPMMSGEAIADTGLWLPTFIVAFIAWAIGLMIVGIPLWIAFHHKGWRSPAVALSVSLAATFIVSSMLTLLFSSNVTYLANGGHVLIQEGWRTLYGWLILLRDSALLALAGGVVSSLIWRIAYRRADRKAGAA